jgi:hypothetical protein
MDWSQVRTCLGLLVWLGLGAGCDDEGGGEMRDASSEPIVQDEAGQADARDGSVDASPAPVPEGGTQTSEASVPDAGSIADASDGAAVDAQMDSAAPTPVEAGPEGVGSISAQWFWGRPSDAGSPPAARVSFTHTAVETRGCTSKTVSGCTVETCSGVTTTLPERISAGMVTARGSRGSCEWNVQASAAPAVCARQLWDPQLFGERVQLTGSGGTFPSFDVGLVAPPRLDISEPLSIGPHARQAGFRFRWSTANISGLVEVWLGRPAQCSAAPPVSSVSVRCSVDAQMGELSIARQVFAELAEQRCLGAIVSLRSARAESIGRFVLNAELSTTREEPYLFATAGEACGGTHAACSTFASDEPSGCTRHGCRWQAGACTGTPHACGAVELPECNNGASGHRGCMRTTM